MADISATLRVVEVDRDWYRKLLEYLLPTERWHDTEYGGKVLYSFDCESGETTRLVFKPKSIGEAVEHD